MRVGSFVSCIRKLAGEFPLKDNVDSGEIRKERFLDWRPFSYTQSALSRLLNQGPRAGQSTVTVFRH
jgi:hypothetical protein